MDSSSLPPTSDETRDIRAILQEIKRQNLQLKRYLYAVGAALVLLLCLEFWPLLKQVLYFVLLVAIVAAVLLTAPVWSKVVVQLTERIPWLPKPRKR